MQLTIIYHLFNNSINLNNSLKSILEQEDQEFSIIFILDQTTEKVRESLKEINFLKKVKHFKIISISQNLGHSYCFNFALPYIDTPYVYFASSSVVLKPNFVSSINNALKDKNDCDVGFFNVHNAYCKSLDFSLLQDKIIEDLYLSFFNSYTNKIFNVEFLRKNKITITNFKHFTTLFLYNVFSKMKSWFVVNEQLVDLYLSSTKNYNTYDLVDQFSAMFGKYINDEFFVKNRKHIEYIAIRTILISFLHDVWVRTAHNKKTFNNAVEYASKWLKTYIPNWSKNEILTSISNNDSRKIIQYLKTFIFKPKNIIKSFSSLEKEI